MYETSCTCEILHRTPHVHCLKPWTGSRPWLIIFYFCFNLPLFFKPFGTQWFWALWLCMLDPAVTYCAPFEPEETVYSFLMFPFGQRPEKFLKARLFIQVRHKTLRGATAWSTDGQKKEEEEEKKKTSHMFWFFALDFGLLLCEASSSRVLFIYMNIL